MGTALVIVESPAKARTINKYLGRGFTVKSSVGHIRDLPVGGGDGDPSARAQAAAAARRATAGMSADDKAAHRVAQKQRQLIHRMGVDPEHGWQARYEVLPGKEKTLAELQALAAKADTIYLATDLDREGEAIAWHLREVIGGDPARYQRVTFSEITKKAIAAAFEAPGAINMDRVNAQQARRFLDRVVGFMVSPLLWQKVARGLSAGRVQSVATRLVVEREHEIHAFRPEEYWEIHADLQSPAGAGFQAQVQRYKGEGFRPVDQAQAEAAVRELTAAAGGGVQVDQREDRPKRSRPNPPFITSTLQQAASVRLGFGVKKTMTLAQRLYEAGFITYMRTDATTLSADAVAACRDFVSERFGADQVPEQPRVYSAEAGAQEAHEAIRPSDVRTDLAALQQLNTRLDHDAERLYDLIWRQFVACQMHDAVFDTSVLTIAIGDYELRARGRVMRAPGWLQVLPPLKSDDAPLPDVAQGSCLDLLALHPSQHFTKPPPRYTEASLVGEMKKRGIGRPSTYAAVISTIQERGYVRQDQRRLYAEKMGDIVTDRLVASFPDILDYDFTARLEDDLDVVAQGQRDWLKVLDRFYDGFKQELEAAAADDGMRPNQPTPTDIPCPTCGRTMCIRTGRTGVFLGCSGYDLPKKERCTTTLDLIPGNETERVADDDELEVEELRHKRRCPLCGTAMDPYLIDESRRLHICGRNPDCPGYEVETGQFKIKGYDGPTIACDKCGAAMELRSGRFGKYFACPVAACGNTRKLLRNGEVAPPKSPPVPMPELPCTKSDGHFVLRDGAAGLFLASSNYPRSRETRNPLIRELVPHRAEMAEKYRHLCDAPAEDDQGRPTVVRFSRKSKEHYVGSLDDNGRYSRWTIFWDPQTRRWGERVEE